MKLINKITNGMILILFGIMHTKLALSDDGGGKQFQIFSKSYFFNIRGDMDGSPIMFGTTDVDTFAVFWFFYWGILVIPVGLLLHSIEKEKRILPHSFTISYLIVIIIGSYMVPQSGMTFFMLPHAIYMFTRNYLKAKNANNRFKKNYT
jgi:hypothetical protein